MTVDEIHPEVLAAMNAIQLPEVQELAERLSKFGLAVAVPHMHDDKGDFQPLPKDKVGFESGLKISFRSPDDAAVVAGIPVMWRWDGELKVAAKCFTCAGACCGEWPK